MMVTVVAMELNIAGELLCRLVYHGFLGGSDDDDDNTQLPLRMGLSTLIDGQFAAATLLISLGAVIGRVTPVQLAIMAICQSLPYAFNKVVISNILAGEPLAILLSGTKIFTKLKIETIILHMCHSFALTQMEALFYRLLVFTH
jgi:hypothetical protein